MFTYRCLQCGKQHSNPDAFAEGYQAQCLRCSHAFEVKREMAQVVSNGEPSGREQAITTAPRSQGHAATAAPSGEREGIRQASAIERTVARTKKPTLSPPDDDEAVDAADATPEELESLERAALPPKEKKQKEDARKKPATVAAKADKKPWLKWAAIVAPVLLVCGVGGYFVFGRSKPVPPVAKATPKPKVTPKAAPPPPKKVEEKKPDPAPPVAVKPTIAFTISAPRLAAEVAAQPAEADRKYKDAWVEVSGLFDKLDTVKPAKGTPVTRALFLTEPGTVACDLSDALPAEMAAWRALKQGKPFNVQGVYTKGGLLTKSRLTETRARADLTFGGKTVELRGLVDGILLPGPNVEFPTIALEGGTNRLVSLHCLFKKEDAQQLKVLNEGTPVTIKGDCAGRRLEAGKYLVRIDNCEFVATTGPAPSVPRMTPMELAREFEEDLRADYFPPPVPRDPAAPTLTVTQLSKEWKADKNALGKYRNRILTVTGRVSKKAPGQLILESPETDQPLKVSCRFGRAIRDRLADLAEYRVYGVCSGMEGAGMLRLDDCGADDSQLRPDGPSLTADYLPHRWGAALVYDFVNFPIAEKQPAKINRQVWFQRDNGVTETVITHTARFSGPSLFAPGHKENWTDATKTSKARIPGPVYVQKTSPLTIDFGQRMPQLKGGSKIEPMLTLKLGVKVGDKWEWTGENGKHSYTLVRFDRWRGKPSAVVSEVIARPLVQGESEVEHVYARGLGEVERREWLRITSTEKKLIWESKIILGNPSPSKPSPAGKAGQIGTGK